MNFATVWGIFALGLGSGAWAASPLDGHWTLDKARSASVDQAIEAVVSQMNFLTRPIARSRLAKTNAPIPTLSIDVADRAEIELGTESVHAPSNGEAVTWTRPDGEAFRVSIHREGERLVEIFQGKDGTRRNTFNLLDAKTLALEVLVESPRLPEPVRYRLVYARTP
jgi:hypothetical protein